MSDCSEAGFSPKSLCSESLKNKVKRVGGKFYGRTDGWCESGTHVKDICSGSTSETSALSEYVSCRANRNGTYQSETGILRCSIDSYVRSSLKIEDQGFESEDDDWEAAADALGVNHVSDSMCAGLTGDREELKVSVILHKNLMTTRSTSCNSTYKCGLISRSASGREWRPDDAHRPASLPNLNKQKSLPMHLIEQNKKWVHVEKVSDEPLFGPSFCPICAEELDTTDSSFEPWECGFPLCLFCHHRVASDDGQCPGCRRFYKSVLPS